MEEMIIINKSELKKVSFAEKEVLDEISRKERGNLLKVAIGMDKDGSGKVGITFQSKDKGRFKVISPILAAGKEYIELKGGQIIPIICITNIHL